MSDDVGELLALLTAHAVWGGPVARERGFVIADTDLLLAARDTIQALVVSVQNLDGLEQVGWCWQHGREGAPKNFPYALSNHRQAGGESEPVFRRVREPALVVGNEQKEHNE